MVGRIRDSSDDEGSGLAGSEVDQYTREYLAFGKYEEF